MTGDPAALSAAGPCTPGPGTPRARRADRRTSRVCDVIADALALSAGLRAALILGALPALVATPLLGQAAEASGPRPAPVVDVPFVPQTPDLCGGAAVAMVIRYWGGLGVSAEDFSHLVSDAERGITTGDLRRAAEALGWRAVAYAAGLGEVRRQLERGRPLIALIQVAPARYHYVVLVGWLEDRVVLHDPARGAFLSSGLEAFDRAWEASGRWAMLLLPDPDAPSGRGPAPGAAEVAAPPPGAAEDAGPRATDACARLVARAVGLAREDAWEAADAALELAAVACPGDPAPPRERAGLRLREGRAAEAAALAERALALDPRDAHAARTLATARYLEGDTRVALRAWNAAGDPRIDLVQTSGARRVPPPTLLRAMELRPGELLTADAFGLAERRLAHLPAAQATRLAYHPLPGGSVRVVASIHETPSLPGTPAELVLAGLRTAADREATLQATSPLRAGEVWTGTGRFESGRPAASLALAVPGAWPAAGTVWSVWAGWERQTYRRPAVSDPAVEGIAPTVEERLRGALEASRWETEWVRWRLGTALDRWDELGSHLALSAGLALRPAGDRLALAGHGEHWFSLEAGSPFARAATAAEWRSRTERRGSVWSLRAGAEFTTSGAPLAVWPGAGEGRARVPYLRAHPLLRSGEVAGPAFGRALAHGGAELALWAPPGARSPLPARFGLVTFLDLARWGKNLPREPQGFLHVDAGMGIRVAPAGDGGTLRLDVARGLRDGETAVTAGWETAWPRLAR